MNVNGYYIETTNLKDVEMILNEIHEGIVKAANEEYHRLLSLEIEYFVDAITVGQEQRPKELAIAEVSRNILNEKIHIASAKQLDTIFNFSISANILLLEKRTYIKINSSQDYYTKYLKKIHSLMPAPLDESWNAVMEKYEDRSLMLIQLLSPRDIKTDKRHLKFSSKIDRAERLARHNLMNHLLAQYAAGRKDIPPAKLMEYVDLAMEELIHNKFYQDELENMKKRALTFLPDIEEELIFGMSEMQAQ